MNIQVPATTSNQTAPAHDIAMLTPNFSLTFAVVRDGKEPVAILAALAAAAVAWDESDIEALLEDDGDDDSDDDNEVETPPLTGVTSRDEGPDAEDEADEEDDDDEEEDEDEDADDSDDADEARPMLSIAFHPTPAAMREYNAYVKSQREDATLLAQLRYNDSAGMPVFYHRYTIDADSLELVHVAGDKTSSDKLQLTAHLDVLDAAKFLFPTPKP